MKSSLLIFLIFFFSCNSTKELYEIKFEVNSSEVDDILFRIEEANLNSLKLEKEAFLSSKHSNDSLYLNTLNSFINNEKSNPDYSLLNDRLIEVFKRIEKKNINKLYVLNMRYTGEMFYENVVIIVEEKESYSPIMFFYDKSSGKVNVKYILNVNVQFLNEFVDNLNYSYLNKSYFNIPPQYFFLSKINLEKGNIEMIKNTFKVKMLNSEMEILNNFLID